MKIAICLLSYGRHDLTHKVLSHNLCNHGIDPAEVGLFVADTLGIAAATNQLLRRAYSLGYQYFCICGNDILEPNNWLKIRKDFIDAHADAGMVSVPVDSIRLFDSNEMVIANWMISRKLLETVGAMDERFDPYGAIDLDYNARCSGFGFKNYYLGGVTAHHIHNHDGVELYGFDKMAKVNDTWQLHVQGNLGHIPLIEMQQM
jgi:hypothetical protein